MLKKIVWEILKFLLIGILVVVILFPVYYLFVISLKTRLSISEDKASILIEEWQWSNFFNVIALDFWKALGFTLIVAVILILLRIFIFSFAVIGLLKLNDKWQKIFLYFFLIISLIPEFTIYLSLLQFLVGLKIHKTFFALTTNSLFSFFLFTYIFNTAKAIHKNKNKLIINDHLKWHHKLIYVYFPKLKLAFLLLIIFSFLTAWNDYLWPTYILNNREEKNITLWFIGLNSINEESTPNLAAAGAFISILVPLCVYWVFSTKIRKFN
ncbi:carbohydrate ABC transporter permease [Mycoplasma miroungirhinis]|uniref:Carbohydrate ABC transporter permease n=1 Tax=Mycoplasma miroungirhinis TaxID=754516 RepID=A0A6M4JDC9_9MOLU|nr:carbohydrate ABC transporter permease [Mycoplasma miroungirhinis]QJR44258.1 carbohydrate ABC transporter permease [Mycoplasma miroungirhinis]